MVEVGMVGLVGVVGMVVGVKKVEKGEGKGEKMGGYDVGAEEGGELVVGWGVVRELGVGEVV
ncbi:hypothetical protein, partial [Kocuria salsicia]|uniref:hypothetical protein n=1 Tax=Kocuria salsicia TaxID=664639 RepID=UPI0016436D08